MTMSPTPLPPCDAFGIINEDHCNLMSPRIVDDTHPTLIGALALAATYIADGAELVSVVSCRWATGSNANSLTPVEDASLVTLTAHADLWDLIGE